MGTPTPGALAKAPGQEDCDPSLLERRYRQHGRRDELSSRDRRIRTSDLAVPNGAPCQAGPYPDDRPDFSGGIGVPPSRGRRIRTSDPLLPKQVRRRAAPCPVLDLENSSPAAEVGCPRIYGGPYPSDEGTGVWARQDSNLHSRRQRVYSPLGSPALADPCGALTSAPRDHRRPYVVKTRPARQEGLEPSTGGFGSRCSATELLPREAGTPKRYALASKRSQPGSNRRVRVCSPVPDHSATRPWGSPTLPVES